MYKNNTFFCRKETRINEFVDDLYDNYLLIYEKFQKYGGLSKKKLQTGILQDMKNYDSNISVGQIVDTIGITSYLRDSLDESSRHIGPDIPTSEIKKYFTTITERKSKEAEKLSKILENTIITEMNFGNSEDSFDKIFKEYNLELTELSKNKDDLHIETLHFFIKKNTQFLCFIIFKIMNEYSDEIDKLSDKNKIKFIIYLLYLFCITHKHNIKSDIQISIIYEILNQECHIDNRKIYENITNPIDSLELNDDIFDKYIKQCSNIAETTHVKYLILYSILYSIDSKFALKTIPYTQILNDTNNNPFIEHLLNSVHKLLSNTMPDHIHSSSYNHSSHSIYDTFPIITGLKVFDKSIPGSLQQYISDFGIEYKNLALLSSGDYFKTEFKEMFGKGSEYETKNIKGGGKGGGIGRGSKEDSIKNNKYNSPNITKYKSQNVIYTNNIQLGGMNVRGIISNWFARKKPPKVNEKTTHLSFEMINHIYDYITVLLSMKHEIIIHNIGYMLSYLINKNMMFHQTDKIAEDIADAIKRHDELNTKLDWVNQQRANPNSPINVIYKPFNPHIENLGQGATINSEILETEIDIIMSLIDNNAHVLRADIFKNMLALLKPAVHPSTNISTNDIEIIENFKLDIHENFIQEWENIIDNVSPLIEWFNDTIIKDTIELAINTETSLGNAATLQTLRTNIQQLTVYFQTIDIINQIIRKYYYPTDLGSIKIKLTQIKLNNNRKVEILGFLRNMYQRLNALKDFKETIINKHVNLLTDESTFNLLWNNPAIDEWKNAFWGAYKAYHDEIVVINTEFIDEYNKLTQIPHPYKEYILKTEDLNKDTFLHKEYNFYVNIKDGVNLDEPLPNPDTEYGDGSRYGNQHGGSNSSRDLNTNYISFIYDFINKKQLGDPEINKIHSMLEYAKLQNKMIVLPTDMEKIKDETQYKKSKKQCLSEYKERHLVRDKDPTNIAIYEDLVPNLDLYSSTVNLYEPQQFLIVDRKLIKMLLSINLDVNLQDHSNRTPLHYAISYLGVGIVKQLLSMNRGRARLFNKPINELDKSNSPFIYYLQLFIDYCNIITGKFTRHFDNQETNLLEDETIPDDSSEDELEPDDKPKHIVSLKVDDDQPVVTKLEDNPTHTYIQLFKQHLETMSKDNDIRTLFIFTSIINKFIENINKKIIYKRFEDFDRNHVSNIFELFSKITPDTDTDTDTFHFVITTHIQEILTVKLKIEDDFKFNNLKKKSDFKNMFSYFELLEKIFIKILKQTDDDKDLPIPALRLFSDYLLNTKQHYDFRYNKDNSTSENVYMLFNSILEETIEDIVQSFIKNDIIEKLVGYLFAIYQSEDSKFTKKNIIAKLTTLIEDPDGHFKNYLLDNLRAYGKQCIQVFFYKKLEINVALDKNDENPILSILSNIKKEIIESIQFIFRNDFNIELERNNTLLKQIENVVMNKYTEIFKLFMNKLSDIFMRYITYIENQLRFIKIGKEFIKKINAIKLFI